MRRLRGLTALGIAAMALSACSEPASGAGNNLPTLTLAPSIRKIVAAENVWGDIAKQIAGDQVEVNSIITDPNTDPHTYELSPATAATIANANLVIANGAGYDDFVSKLLAGAGNRLRTVITIANVVGATTGDANPHLWYQPEYVVQAATAIQAQLAAKDPSGASRVRANLRRFVTTYQDDVLSLIKEIKQNYSETRIAYTERVAGYLVKAAGLQLGTPASFAQAIEDGSDPSPSDIAQFQAALQRHTVKAMLYNSQVISPVTQRLREIAARNGVPVIGVTETLPPRENFQAWQANQLHALLNALGDHGG
jgi:zinc/manganese transport system substrate-binding protein